MFLIKQCFASKSCVSNPKLCTMIGPCEAVRSKINRFPFRTTLRESNNRRVIVLKRRLTYLHIRSRYGSEEWIKYSNNNSYFPPMHKRCGNVYYNTASYYSPLCWSLYLDSSYLRERLLVMKRKYSELTPSNRPSKAMFSFVQKYDNR